MTLNTELDLLEQERDVYGILDFIENDGNQNLDNYLRVLFVLLDFLVDGQYVQEQHDFFSMKIKEIFNDAKLKYSHNYDFLFFAGIMIYIAEWYFGFENIDEAKKMLEDAMKSNPENIIYTWGYYAIVDQSFEANVKLKRQLSKQILKDNSTLEWLHDKGLLGEYVLGIIQSTYEATKSKYLGLTIMPR